MAGTGVTSHLPHGAQIPSPQALYISQRAAAQKIIATMARRKIVADLTLGAFESLYVPENGDLSPSYAPFVGTMPPATERGVS
mgnify:CR=1 FL=1